MVVRRVIGSVHREDHRTRAKEQQRLEERVRHQMKDAGGIRAHAHADEHVAQLRDRRVRENFLDVPLLQSNRRGEDSGERADHDNCQRRNRRE